MLKSVENSSARLGYYSFVFGLLTFVGSLFPQFEIPVFLSVIVVIVSFSFFILSFSTSKWQTYSRKSKKRILWGLFFLPFVLYIPVNLGLLSIGIVELKLHDFGAYYNAAVRWLHNAPLYQTTQEIPALDAQISGSMPYLYPPIVVLIFVPFTFLPPVISGVVWDLTILTFLIWSVSMLISTFNVTINRRKKLLLYFAVASFGPTITWMKAGQISGLLAALLCLSGATLRSNRHGLSGAFTTLGGIVKPFYATSGAHLLRHRKRFLSAVVSGAAILLFGLLVFGVDTHLEYLDVLRQGKGWETATGPTNWNAGHFNPFYILGPLKHLPRIIIVLGTAGLALYSNKTEIPIEYIFALGVSIVPLAGPTTNTLALSASIPAILMVGFYELEHNGEFPKILAISTLLIHIHPYTVEFVSKFGPQIYPPLKILTPVIPLLQPALYGMGLLVGYLVYRSWKNPVV
ncbi:glycosyltransferase family 87 protein [Halosegnis rubeus]|uniref:DUF2029 domain-containing protein n=1 Tax=Halosegnis rubeus TaxID=2212850 RepID=A0A5N5U9N6_9EURY|nr:glycosyltransferase family 87 protein [Halosegnis rubeus]KAB7515335.1 DUF2029 domain-containing protein [Halosegnis rubeus]